MHADMHKREIKINNYDISNIKYIQKSTKT